MPQVLWGVGLGIELENGLALLDGVVAPGGTDLTDNAPNGSLYLQSGVEPKLWIKSAALTWQDTAERPKIIATGITTQTVVDSVLVDQIAKVTWDVYIQATADGTKKYAVTVTAIHDGHNVGAGADATNAGTKSTEDSRLKIGSISGLKISVIISGTGPTQLMSLAVESGISVFVKATRQTVDI